MRILHLITSLATGGAEKLIAETLPLYHKKGIVADVLVLNGKKHPLFKELEASGCCRIISLGEGSVYNPLHIFKIIPYLKQYDLFHAHLFATQYFTVVAKMLSFSKKPLVFTEHNTSNRRIQNKSLAILDKWVYARYKKVICITADVKKALQQHAQLPGHQVVIINNGINIETSRNALKLSKSEIHLSLSDKDFLLMHVAGFRSQKDQPTVIRALLLLPNNVKLVLVGDGGLRGFCENMVKEMGLEQRVFFIGLRNDVPALYKTCDVGVLSSKWEGFGLVAVEGMASGKPFIASDVPGLSDVVGGAGILFPQGNEQKLAEEIMKLMDSRAYREEVGERGRERAAKYDINIMVDKHIKLYKDVLGI